MTALIFFLAIIAMAFILVEIMKLSQRADWRKNRRLGESYNTYCKRVYARWY